MKLCAEQKTPQHSARSIWELVGRMQAHTHSVLLGNLGTDRKFTSKDGDRSARLSELPVRPQVPSSRAIR